MGVELSPNAVVIMYVAVGIVVWAGADVATIVAVTVSVVSADVTTGTVVWLDVVISPAEVMPSVLAVVPSTNVVSITVTTVVNGAVVFACVVVNPSVDIICVVGASVVTAYNYSKYSILKIIQVLIRGIYSGPKFQLTT